MEITVLIAFLGGILSVLSPCLLPLIPAYFGYISGIKVTEAENHKLKILIHALFFCLGFSIVFIIFGAVIGSIGKFILINKRIIEITGGIIIILLAIQASGLLEKLSGKFNLFCFLSSEHRPSKTQAKIAKIQKFQFLKSLLTGAVFSLGWSPCYGPILGGILTLTIAEQSFFSGTVLFSVYSLGMAIPLIILALLSSHLSTIISKTKKFRKYYSIIMASLLLLLGIWMITGETGDLANTINNLYIKYNFNKF